MNDIDRNIGIYKITSPSGKVYIGESGDLKGREDDYRKMRCKQQPFIYNSLKKYGFENHIFEVIGNCLYEDLKKLEHLIVAEYRELLGEKNVMTLKTGYEDKYYIAESTRIKQRKSHLGKKASEETREKIRFNTRGEKNPFYGKKHSDEVREKQRKSRLGKKSSEETREKIRFNTRGEKNPFYGKKHSDEVIKFQRESRLGKKLNDETIEKLNVKINQYDLNGKYIRYFNSVKEIYYFINKTMGGDVSQVCKGKRKTAYSYIWRYHSEYPDCKDLIL